MISREPNLGDAIISLAPESEWSIEGDDLKNLVWIVSPAENITHEQITDELYRLKESQVADQLARQAAKESALAKLTELGLTEEEAKAVIGIG